MCEMKAIKNAKLLVWEQVEEHIVTYDRSVTSYRGTGKLGWEKVTYKRAKVPGGWLVRARAGMFVSKGAAPGVIFIPDPTYAWAV